MMPTSRVAEWLQGPAIDTFFDEPVELSDLQVAFSPGEDGYPISPVPSYIGLEVTNTCNLHCVHCHYRHGALGYTREKGFMSPEVFEIAVSQAAKHGISVLMNYDGEPLLHPKFIDYLQRATELGVNSYFNTNATLLTPDRVDRILSFYKGAIFVSMEGGKEWFEKIRTPASYEVVAAHLAYLIEANERLGRPVKLSVGVSNLGQPLAERQAMLQKWLPGLDAMTFGEVNDDCGAMISEPFIRMQPRKRPLCVVPWQTCGICHNGDVIPCSIYIAKANTTDAILGNIREQSLADIWTGEAYTRFREALLRQNHRDAICARCTRWRSQFSFPDEFRPGLRIQRSGYWTVVHNIQRESRNS